MGVPISALLPTATLAATDAFAISIGSALGDNRKINWAALQTLIQLSASGQVVQSIQTISYANNNNTPVVITGHNVILTEGKWLLDFSSSVLSGGLVSPNIEYYLVYNVNPLLTAYNITDVQINGSIRLQMVPFPAGIGNTCIYTKGEAITVPALGSYIVKVVVSDPLSADYIIQDRILTAIKVL